MFLGEDRLMSRTSLGAVLQHIYTLAGSAAARRMTDLHLLHRFAEERDENAFAELMRRHGPLVLSVCRRLLGHEQDAEDAFQAAFLVLARKAGLIRKGESVGSFLYGVAYRIAMKERSKLAQRRQREQQAKQPTSAEPVREAAVRELQILLDEGLNRLPEKYRAPFVLCCLESKSKSEAARELGWKEGTVSSRLARARKELQRFLTRKGVTLTAVLTAAGIAENVTSACVPPLLAATAVRAARLFASGPSAALKTVQAVQLAETVLRSMTALPWKTTTALLLVVSLAVGRVGLVYHAETAQQAPASEPAQATASAAQKPAREKETPRTDRYGDPLPEGALARLGTIRFRQGFFTYRAVYSPDGKTIACASVGRGLCLWDATTGKELRCFGQSRVAHTVAFAPDGKMLVSDVTGPLALFDVASGKLLTPLSDARGNAQVAFAPDGKAVAVSQNIKGFGVWDIDDAVKARKRFVKEEKQTTCIAFSKNGTMLATGGTDKIIYLWDPKTGKELGRLTGHNKEVYRLAFSPDGRKLLSVSPDDSLRLWDVTERRPLHVLDGKHSLSRTAAFSPDGKTLASGHGDGTIVLWDVDNGKELRCWHGHNYVVLSVEFSPNGTTLLSAAAWECGPRQWDVATGAEKHRWDGHLSPVDALTFSPDGTSLLSQGRDKTFLHWELRSGRPEVRFDHPLWAVDHHYQLSPIGDTAATWSYKDDVIRLWDVATNKERHTLGKFPDSDQTYQARFFAPLAFSADGRLLAFGGTEDHEVIIWDVTSGKERQRCKGLKGNIRCVAFSPDGKRIAAGVSHVGVRPTIAVWDVSSGAKGADFASKEIVDNLIFSPDGRMIASTTWQQGQTRLWDVESGHELRPLSGAVKAYGLAFSPDGKWLAAAGEDWDQKVHVWEVNTGQEVRCISGHYAGVMSIAFAPDGRTLASGGCDSTILLWDVTGRMKNGRWQNVKWTPRELEKRWIDLGGVGPQAVQALWDLVASPEQAVPLLRQRIKKVEPVDVERLVRDLDSDDFQTRTKATDELEKIVDGAEPVLRKKLAEKPSLEMRQRIRQVLSKLEPSSSSERLRALRAIQVLEYTRTAEAREHLQVLAKGIPEARLTREAKEALERLAK
jgi:RNA polymerase sigma factor (sigma-70 family)